MSLARLSFIAHRTSLRSIRVISTKAAPQYEFLIIIRDLPHASRKRQTLPPMTASSPVLASQTFKGEILTSSVKVLGDEVNQMSADGSARGNVLACRAASAEDVEGQIRGHPYAEGVWDMESMTIWPLDTVHTSPFSSGTEQ